jgi:WD40 repeat protein
MVARGAIVAVLCAGCGRVGFDDLPAPPPGDAACVLGAWSTPVPLVELNSPSIEFAGALTDDELQIVFMSDRPGGPGGYDLYLATRGDAGAVFDAPQLLAQLSTPADEQGPTFSADGLTLYFVRGAPAQLFRTTRASPAAAFGAPQLVQELAAIDMSGADLSRAGDELFYTINQKEIDRATFDGMTFTPLGPVTELNAGAMTAGFSSLSADGLTIYFASIRTGSMLDDIYTATRPSIGAPFGNIAPLVEVSTPAHDGDPEIGASDRTLITNYDTGSDYDLYVAKRSCSGGGA